MTFTSGFLGGFGLAVAGVKRNESGVPQLPNRVVALRAGTASQPLGYGLSPFGTSPFGTLY
jgi:hypothetical protein